MASEKDFQAALEFARNSVASYARLMWPAFENPHHIQYLSKILHEVESAKRDRIIITLPPRHGKSNLCSQFFPAWYLGRHPDHFVISSSYAQHLADDFGRKVRNLLTDPMHRAVFPNSIISEDSASVQKLAMTNNGGYYAIGRGGSITGRGGHLIIIDDPLKDRAEANSDTTRRMLQEWFQSVVYTRLMVGGKILVIQTRWHEDDLAGWLLREHIDDGWQLINLPAIAEEDEEWRKEGEALWPSRYPISLPAGAKGMSLERIRRAIGSQDFQSLYQQRTGFRDGNDFKASWLDDNKFTKINHQGMTKYILVDPANNKKKTSDYTAMIVIGLNADRNVYVLDMIRDKLSLTERAEKLFRLHKKWKPIRSVVYEQYGAQADKSYFEEKMDQLSYHFRVQTVGGQVKKEDRIRRLVPWFESGRIYTPETVWYTDSYESKEVDLLKTFRNEEFLAFPSAVHDDMMDALSRFLDPSVQLDWPMTEEELANEDYSLGDDEGGWMSA